MLGLLVAEGSTVITGSAEAGSNTTEGSMAIGLVGMALDAAVGMPKGALIGMDGVATPS